MVIGYSIAATLVGLGIYSLVRHRHQIRMRMDFRDLTVCWFLMA
jgi:hypothetical protein